MLHFWKSARNFFIMFSPHQVDSISFHMNLVNQLAALACQSCIYRNKDRIKRPIGQNLGKSLHDMTSLDVILLKKRLKMFFMIFSLGKVDNISFHINLVSQLAPLVCQPDVHRNKDRRKQLIGRNLVISLYNMSIFRWHISQKRIEIVSQYSPCIK